MKTIKLIRFIEEPKRLNDLDMNQIRGGNVRAGCTYTCTHCTYVSV